MSELTAQQWNDAIAKAVAMVRTPDGKQCFACPTMEAAEAQFEKLMNAGKSVDMVAPCDDGRKRFGPHCLYLKSFSAGEN